MRLSGGVDLSPIAEAEARRALELGESDRLDLATVRAEVTQAQRAEWAAFGRVQGALGAVEDSLQRPLDPSEPALQIQQLLEPAHRREEGP